MPTPNNDPNPQKDSLPPRVEEDFVSYGSTSPPPADESHDLIRTQIHLSEAQRSYLTNQAKLSGLSMAAQIRHLIDEQMNPTQTNWGNNPLLEETVVDPEFSGAPDASTTSDSLIYGSYEG
ncbi:MAG: hypothetical protein ACSHYF_07420 [Verrucomicrobiaceae bacterium]